MLKNIGKGFLGFALASIFIYVAITTAPRDKPIEKRAAVITCWSEAPINGSGNKIFQMPSPDVRYLIDGHAFMYEDGYGHQQLFVPSVYDYCVTIPMEATKKP